MIVIDGSRGEGGGQVLRTALTLSLVTGEPFRLESIRAGRRKPGLMRQHLACVRAAAAICDGEAHGAEIGSQHLTFTPGRLRSGDHHFAIGSAGSTLLLLQTIALPLALAGGASTLVLEGGTHNPAAPPFEFVARAWLPLVRRIGFVIEADCVRPGFYPAGGGRVDVAIAPAAEEPVPLRIEVSEGSATGRGEVLICDLALHIAERERQTLARALGWDESAIDIRRIAHPPGPGNVVLATIDHGDVAEVISGHGERGRSAEAVAEGVAEEVAAHLAHGAPVGLHLADQLLLPMVLGAGGSFVTAAPSAHLRTNLEVVAAFLGPNLCRAVAEDGGRFRVTVERGAIER